MHAELVSDVPTVFIVDDDPAARDSVAALVQSKGLPVETFASAEEFLASGAARRCGCAVIDVRMAGLNGLELQQRLRQQGSCLPVIVITAYADVPLTVKAMQNGAITLLQKPCGAPELWESIQQGLAMHTQQRIRQAQQIAIETRLATLTPEERRVMDLIVAGQQNKAIAGCLGIGLRTVELRRAGVMQKLQAQSVAELVRLVISAGESPRQTVPQRPERSGPVDSSIPQG